MADREGMSVRVPSPRLPVETEEAGSGGPTAEDPDNYPLNSSWSFWFYKSSSDSSDFFANLRHLASVNTIKAFWSVYNNLPSCGELQDRDSYHLMRDGHAHRRPVWEDLDNVDGGTWTVKISKESTVELWQELLLAAVGEQLSTCVADEDEVCGVSVSCRLDSDVLTIWHQDSAYQHASMVLDELKRLVPGVMIRHSFYVLNRDRVKEYVSKSSGRGRSGHPPGHKSQVAMATNRSSSTGHQRGMAAVRTGASSTCYRYPTPTVPTAVGALPVPHNQPHPHFHGYHMAPQAPPTTYSVRAPVDTSLPLTHNTGTMPHPP